MADIIPFKGILYNPKKIKDISKVVAPPYDVISNKDQKRYYRKHKYNIIRLILGKDFSNDDTTHNKYTRARDYFHTWLKKDILLMDEKPSIYVYQEEYHYKEKKKKQIGFIALVKLEYFKNRTIFPHERTFRNPKQDRLKLLRMCEANFSSIFSLYSDSTKQIDKIFKKAIKGVPAINIVNEDKIKHKLWKISNPEIINKLIIKMKDKLIFIADGHHRYETAINFRDEIKRKLRLYKRKGNFDYVMMYFTNMEDKNLTILPTHRLLSSFPKGNLVDLEKYLEKFFEIKIFKQKDVLFSQLEKIKRRNLCVFGMYKKEKDKYYLLTLKENKLAKNSSLPKINVSIFHRLILKNLLGIDTKKKEEKYISYTRDETLAIKMVNKGKFRIAFFLPQPIMEGIKNIAYLGNTLPQKTTYFYPKLLTGLVLNQIRFSE